MTWNSHSYVGLFQSIFYVVAFIGAAALLFRKHGRPRTAWVALTLFCAVRITGGIILIVYEDNVSSVALTIVTIIFQGTGVIPLLLSTIGMLRIIKYLDFYTDTHLKRLIIVMRVIFFVGIVLLIAGSVLIGEYTIPSDVSTGAKLVKAGYIILAAILGWIAAIDLIFWWRYGELSDSSRNVALATTASIPFLAVRIVYACLSIFTGNPKWSPLTGSVVAFVVMHLVMEYVVACMYIAVGFILPSIHTPAEGAVAGIDLHQRQRPTDEEQVGQWK